MLKLNKLWKFIKGLFVKEIDQNKLFNDVSNFIETQPKIDYRQLKRDGKELFKVELEGEEIQFGSNADNVNKLTTIKNAPDPQNIVPIFREMNFVSTTRTHIKTPCYSKNGIINNSQQMISAEDMQREIEIEEEYDVKNNN